MKILLVGINAKYSHQNLALEYIKRYNENPNIKTREFNINQNIESIYSEILREKPDVLGFSTYIWNFDFVIRLSSDLKKAMENLIIIWGGPEVSFDNKELMEKNESVDIIIRDEGEVTSKELFETLENHGDLSKILGITYRDLHVITENPDRPLIENLDILPSPFKDYNAPDGKMVYYEMSRGCPFKCAYCLSSTIKGVRYFSIERIKSDLLEIINSNATTVKLVDRTFNSNEKFSMEIMNFIIENKRDDLVFHMELMAHLISDNFLKFLEKMPKGLFQFEIGIQSSNEKTLREISRLTNLEKLKNSVKTIKSYGNIHQHVDLIAGLPFEDFDSFKNSFNYAYSLEAEKLQLGFLKLLRGSSLRKKAEELGIIYSEFPPYEVISTKWMTPEEISKLKIIEDVVEKFSNEDYFKWSLEYLIEESDPFSFFEDLAKFWEENGYHLLSHSRASLYERFVEFIKDRKDYEGLVEVIRLDYLLNQNSPPKDYLNPQNLKPSEYHELLKDEKIRKDFNLDLSIPTKKLVKEFKFQGFGFGGQRRIFGFNYTPKGTNRLDITEDYERIINGIY